MSYYSTEERLGCVSLHSPGIYSESTQILCADRLDPVIKQGKWQFYFTGTRSKLARICDLFTLVAILSL